jgi:hypothetical protein
VVDEAELRLHPLPRPTDAEVETLAATVARRTLALLRARGVLEEEAAPDGALDVLPLEGIQVPRSPPTRRRGRRCAFVKGFSLHADWLHENDVTGLERMCNYGARGPCRSSGSRLCATDGSLTGGGSAGTTRGRTRALGAKTPK